MMRDDELRRALNKWQTPQPREALDRRVFASCTPAAVRGRVSWKLWGAVAAGVLVMVAANFFSPATPQVPGDPTRLETRLTATGFRPIPDAAVTVVKVRAK